MRVRRTENYQCPKWQNKGKKYQRSQIETPCPLIPEILSLAIDKLCPETYVLHLYCNFLMTRQFVRLWKDFVAFGTYETIAVILEVGDKTKMIFVQIYVH